MAAVEKITMLSSPDERKKARMGDLWNSPEKLASLITAANWGIALTLLTAFLCTVVAIKTGGRKDELSNAEALEKREKIAQLGRDTEQLKSANIQLGIDLQTATAESKQRQSELEIEQRKTAEAQEAAATAQLVLKKYVSTVAERQFPREVDRRKMVEMLKGKPKCPVSFWYSPGDTEAYRYASMLSIALGEGDPSNPGAGWEVSAPIPIPADEGYQGQNLSKAPPAMRFMGVLSTFAVTFVQNPAELNKEQTFDSPINSLRFAILGSTLPSSGGAASFGGEYSKAIPVGAVGVVVGPKPPPLVPDPLP